MNFIKEMLIGDRPALQEPVVWTLLLLLILSIVSLSVIIERLWFWLSILSKEREIASRVLDAATQDWSIAREIARRSTNKPVGRFLYAPLRLGQTDPEMFRLALEASAEDELAGMRRGDKILEAVISLAPLVGLLGTVAGLILALRSLGLSELGKAGTTERVSLEIGKALISTAGGLLVAITSLVFYRLFQVFLSNQVKIFRRAGNELELLYRQSRLQVIDSNYASNNSSAIEPSPSIRENDLEPDKQPDLG